MSRAAKQKSVAKLIEIINKLIERQEKLLNHIAELEDYVHALESLNEFEDLLDKLEADQLPRQKNRRFSRAQDLSNFTVNTTATTAHPNRLQTPQFF